MSVVLLLMAATVRPTFALLLAFTADVVGGAACFLMAARRVALTVSDDGVADRRLWRMRRWSWGEVVVVALGPETGGRWTTATGPAYFMVCLRDDPYPRTLKGVSFRPGLEALFCLDRLAHAGYPVDARTGVSPDVWWVDDPRRRRMPS